jgi:hypothetical protein
MLLKKAMKNELPLMAKGKEIMDEIMAGPSLSTDGKEGLLGEEFALIENAKKAFLMASGIAARKFMNKIDEEQELLLACADMIIQVFAMESACLRAMKLIKLRGEEKAKIAINMTKSYIAEAIPSIDFLAKRVLAHSIEGDELNIILSSLRRFVKVPPVDTISLKKEIANKIIALERYEI